MSRTSEIAARAASGPGLYVHVPFCARRCHYCDFSSGGLSSAAVERYLRAVEIEAEQRASGAAGVRFRSVFFGGGTPSALSPRHFARLWEIVASRFTLAPGAEITLEANPESVKSALLDAWAAAGINRLSMGVQSFDDTELEGLGRIHDCRRPVDSFALARRHGFGRLSLDLMFGFPGHRPDTWRATIASALELGPEHLSAYCFIPEPGTVLGQRALSGQQALPTPDEQADSYDILCEALETRGYVAYETSNFAQPGGESRHNLAYWLRRDGLGLGPAAHGLWRGVREGNFYSFEAWAAALEEGRPWAETESETAASRADEIVMLALRLGEGLRPEDYPPSVWDQVRARYGRALGAAADQGRIERRAGGYRIAPRHRFVADDVIAWLAARADLTPAETGP